MKIPKNRWSEPQPIDCNNWKEQFPYSPTVTFALKHDSERLYIRFDVQEKYTKAEIKNDNGRVWTDSCVEFFVAFDESGYYNFEFTCVGKALLAFRKTKPEPTAATPEIMALIKRDSSLGNANFTERVGDNCWTLEVAIPKEAFFKHRFDKLDGILAKANFYKCGDELSEAHFLSWTPIGVEAPNFHLPQYFGHIEFE